MAGGLFEEKQAQRGKGVLRIMGSELSSLQDVVSVECIGTV